MTYIIIKKSVVSLNGLRMYFLSNQRENSTELFYELEKGYKKMKEKIKDKKSLAASYFPTKRQYHRRKRA